MFASASPDNIKQWKCPEGSFIQNLSGHNAIVNCLAVNPEGVLVSGADNGTLHCWDWRTGYNFQRLQVSRFKSRLDKCFKTYILKISYLLTQAPVQPGSMDSESGVFSMTFDQSGSRLITTEADKTIKIYKEDESAVSVIVEVSVSKNFLFMNIIIILNIFQSEETHPIHWRPEILKRRKY